MDYESMKAGVVGFLESVGEAAAPHAEVWSNVAEKSAFLKFDIVDAQAEKLADLASFPKDQVLYVLCLLLAYPLGMIFHAIPNKTAKHAFSLLFGLLFAQNVFGAGWFHSFFSAGVVYVWLALCSLVPALGKYRHWFVWVWMMGYMTVSHLHRQYTRYMLYELDFTGAQMILTIKMTSLAVNFFDGAEDKVRMEREMGKDKEGNKSATRLYRRRLAKSIDTLPNPLEFFGYVFNFCSYLAGPAFEYREYLDSITGDKYIDGKHPQGRVLASLGKLGFGLAILALKIVFGGAYPLEDIYSQKWAVEAPMLQRIAHAWICIAFVRFQYYFAWLVAEGGAVMAGFGYEPRTKTWNGVQNMDVLGFELCPSISAGAKAWNKCTQNWLGSYVFTRTPRGASMWITYFVSAFWHGFYPGYYLFFLSVPLGQNLDKAMTARVKPHMFLDKKCTKVKPGMEVVRAIYKYASFVFVSLSLNYLSSVFVVMSWEHAITVWSSFAFGGHIFFAVALAVVTYVVPKPRFEEEKEGKKEK
jgi:hypothetical protein